MDENKKERARPRANGVQRQLAVFRNPSALCLAALLAAMSLLLGKFLQIPTPLSDIVRISFENLPVILSGILLGPLAGALLGLEFGVIVFVAGFVGADGFTFILIQDHPIYTALICIGKGVLAGFGAGLVYRLLANKNKLAAVIAAAATTPIINTALFIIGALFMQSTLKSNFLGEGETVVYFLIVVCAGVNFLLELLLNLLVAPALARAVDTANRRIVR